MTGIPQGSVLGPSLFLISTNNLPEGVTSLFKKIVDDTSLFSKAANRTHSETELIKDLKLISQWVYHWKMFNPDPTKQGIKLYCFINVIMLHISF